MYEKRKLGFWKEYGWRNLSQGLEEKNFSSRYHYIPDKKEIEYLYSGIPLVGIRRNVECILTGEPIGSPTAFTDGEFFWTREYLFYIENGYLALPSDFKIHMELRSYQIPSREEIGEDILDKIMYSLY